MIKGKAIALDFKEAFKNIPDDIEVLIMHEDEHGKIIGEEVKGIVFYMTPEKIVVIAGESMYTKKEK